MNKTNLSSYDVVFTALLTAIFFIILPGLVAALGTMAGIYFDGLRELPPFGLKAASAAVGMLAISYFLCSFLKADRQFMSWPFRLTLAGAILLPFARGSQQAFTLEPMDNAATADRLVAIQQALEAIAKGFIEIVPAALCTVSVVMLAFGLTCLLRTRYGR